ncbi:MAG: protein translocase subunit SecF [Oscillospiraceae bacterium]|nr:protein translocase subunit SecF [Oscillospiraceae bacterium]
MNVLKNKSKFYTISTSLFVVFALVAVIFGLNVAIEFKGGTLLAYSYDGDLDTKKIETIVEDTVDEKVTVKTGEQFSTGVKTVELSFASSEGLSSDKLAKLDAELTKQLPDNNIEGLSTTDVSPTNGKSFFLKCLVAVVFAAVVMVVYIGFRFKKIGGWSAGCMAVVALCHDMIMVFGSFVIFRFDINANFMAVLLTILGYSINATIIIYDRIRENRRLYGNKYKVEELVNMSVSQTMGRSIHTTVTTVLAMSVVCIVCAICGVTSILSFALPLIVGMVAGVYSSNCIAPTLWVMWQNRTAKKNKK